MPSPFPIESQIPFRISFSLIFFFFSTFSLFLPLSLSLSHNETNVSGIFCRKSSDNSSSSSNASRHLLESSHPFTTHLKVKTRSWAILTPDSPAAAAASPNLYALAQCFGGLSQTDCDRCLVASQDKIKPCLRYPSGRIYLDGCFLRYERFRFFKQWSDPQTDTIKCSRTCGNITDPSLYHEFLKKLANLFINVTGTASEHDGFGLGEAKGGVNPVYILAQCWKTVSKTGCIACLKNAARGLISCVPGKEGIAMNAGCYMRYSTNKFYGDKADQIDDSDNKNPITVVVILSISCLAFLLLSLVGGCLGYARLSENNAERRRRKVANESKSNLNFNYETLERATDSFNPSRKLGQGGGGSVFRGDLPDGRTVAVKRLFFSNRQWVDEFFNEVNLISEIQHKNLIKLLGCSIEGPASLLVFEFAPNMSLDQYLFGKNKTITLSWEQRLNIIVGTAEGLAHLHDGSQKRIIHRDMKCSNIFLDENMTAKIADFGLARPFSADKTHLSTGIAGTMGYMAPEYLVRGQLTEKADVFSFGVVVLEVVCGRRNSIFVQEAGSVLHTVWNHYQSSTLSDSIDPSLGEDFPVEEACNVLRIGLLCTQATVSSRPSMAEVVQMLTNEDYIIPTPTNPPFMNNSATSDTTEFFSVCSSSFGALRSEELSQPRWGCT
ncbi:cysteine-rich receptor-like protein kinase 42 isoform X2 [Macadamia integrifolia]|nr:cysteine-rich receptor-like protein kinase 42 isoform X2 [Macadamia integrifolia]